MRYGLGARTRGRISTHRQLPIHRQLPTHRQPFLPTAGGLRRRRSADFSTHRQLVGPGAQMGSIWASLRVHILENPPAAPYIPETALLYLLGRGGGRLRRILAVGR